MAVCGTCHGRTTVDGGYQPCAGCGGSGSRNGDRCGGCMGSGRSSYREQVICPSCHGSGQSRATPSPAPRSRPSPAPPTGKPKPPSGPSQWDKPWTGANTGFLLLSYFAIVGFLAQNSEMEGWPLWLLPVIPAAIIGRFWQHLLVIAIIGGIAYAWLTKEA